MLGRLDIMNIMTAFAADTAQGTYGRRDRMEVRRGILGCGSGFTAALDESGKLRYAGDNRWGQKEALAWTELLAVYCGPDYVLGLGRDGVVYASGRAHDHGIEVESWAAVTAIACGQRHAAALIGNGQILASGDDRYGQCSTDAWTDMVDVCCGANFTVGLSSDGHLRVAGGDKHLGRIVERWEQIAGVFSDEAGKQVLAITSGEGRLLSTAALPACTKKWRNLVHVAASARGVYGITATGRLLSSHKDDQKKLDQEAKDYFACAAGPHHLSVLCRSGEVISLGQNDFGQCATARWGVLFKKYEAFNIHRREDIQKKEHNEKFYQQRLSEAKRFSRRLACGERLSACIQADGHVNVSAGLRRVKSWRNVCALSCGSAHLLALHKDGTVSAEGNNVGGCCRVGEWRGVKAVLAGKYHSLGLCEDGTVLFAGWNVHEQGHVSEWRNIRLLRCTDTYTVGVARDGTIHASGKKLPFDPEALDRSEWSELTDLAVSEHHMVGLRKDGRVVTVWDPDYFEASIPQTQDISQASRWHGIRAIAVGEGFTVGLCYGGQVLAVGQNHLGQCDTQAWKNAVSVACGRGFTAALLADGRVVTTGQHLSGQGQKLSTDEIGEAVMDWEKAEATGYEPFNTQWMSDVLTIQCGKEYLVAVDRFGQVMAEGLDLDGQCTAASVFVLFRDIRQLDGFGVYTGASDFLPQTSAAEEDPEAPRGSAVPFSELTVSTKSEATLSVRKVGQARTTEATRQVLRTFAESVADRIFCGDSHITVSKQDGRVISCHLAKGKLLEEAPLKPPSPTLALTGRGDRTVMVFGDGRVRVRSNFKNPVAIESLPFDLGSRYVPVKAVSEGAFMTAVLLKDGTVRLIGRGEEPTPDVSLWQHVTAIATGRQHVVGLTADGRVLAVGKMGRTPEETRVVQAACRTQGWQGVISLLCGAHVTYGLCQNGDVLATGDQAYGQCNTEGWHHVASLATSGDHTVALFHDGRVSAIGKNDNGECHVQDWQDIIMVCALPGLTLGLTADGRVLSAGRHTGTLPLTDPVYSMAVFGQKQVFVTSDGTLRLCVGAGDKPVALPQALSLFGDTPGDSLLLRISTLLPWDVMARDLLGQAGQGMTHGCYLTDQSTLRFVGHDDRPSPDGTLQRAYVWVSAGPYHTVAITADGRLVSFGAVPENRSITALEAALAGEDAPLTGEAQPLCRSVVCGIEHTAAVRGDGRVVAVGRNDHGQCDTQAWERVSMVACGVGHTVAMTHQGRALAAGDNTHGQCSVDAWRDLVMVACGESHTVGLMSNGRVVATGDNRLGQCGVEKAKGIISVACLPEATLCVRGDGHVELYGGTGELRERVASLRDVVAVYTCEYRLSALTSDGRVLCIN